MLVTASCLAKPGSKMWVEWGCYKTVTMSVRKLYLHWKLKWWLLHLFPWYYSAPATRCLENSLEGKDSFYRKNYLYHLNAHAYWLRSGLSWPGHGQSGVAVRPSVRNMIPEPGQGNSQGAGTSGQARVPKPKLWPGTGQGQEARDRKLQVRPGSEIRESRIRSKPQVRSQILQTP